MLRSFIIYLSTAPWAKNLVTGWSFAWKAASRFVAGEKVEDAVRAIRELNGKGINATLDCLGEHTSTVRHNACSRQKHGGPPCIHSWNNEDIPFPYVNVLGVCSDNSC